MFYRHYMVNAQGSGDHYRRTAGGAGPAQHHRAYGASARGSHGVHLKLGYIVTMMYLGPDTAMPLASAFAAIVGIAVLFWHKTVAAAKGVARFVGRQFSRLTQRH